jgi:hypothetical protein
MSKLYTEKDFADVVDESGNVIGQAPKAWKGTDLLPPGHSIKGGGRSASASSGAGSSGSANDKDENAVPAESENRDVLEAYAVKHAGISEEDAKAFPNKGELHAAIVKANAGS